MGLVYRPSPSVNLQEFKNRPVFSTEQGGLIFTDRAVAQLWSAVADSSLLHKQGQYSADIEHDQFTRAALACLAEAGLLERIERKPQAPVHHEKPEGGLVSVIIICHESLDWLKICLPSLAAQSYSPLETILVDNASIDGTAGWINVEYPSVAFLRLDTPSSLSTAINFGISKASGNYFLLLNPDTRLAPDSIANLVRTALTDPLCAAVAAKLRLLWAPAFLNGLGNYVGGISWGADTALGHLDLAQFDRWKVVPSACFAAALIPATAWKEVGELDVGFPMYYEDSEWCYRARKYGYRILASPEALVYHAFSGQISLNAADGMDIQKLSRVAYGRLRFASLLFTFPVLLRFLAAYFIEDFFRIAWHLLSGRFKKVSAHILAWKEFKKTLPAIIERRSEIQSKGKINDRELLALLREVPEPLVQHGIPLLTRDVIENELLPLMLAGKTKKLPEFLSTSHPEATEISRVRRKNWISRLLGIWQNEGFVAVLYRLGRLVERRLL